MSGPSLLSIKVWFNLVLLLNSLVLLLNSLVLLPNRLDVLLLNSLVLLMKSLEVLLLNSTVLLLNSMKVLKHWVDYSLAEHRFGEYLFSVTFSFELSVCSLHAGMQ